MKTPMLAFAGATLVAAALIGHSSAQQKPAFQPAPENARTLASAQNDFGVKLMRELHEPGKNTFISPTSITQAMQLALMAADGETEAEMRKAMGLEGIDYKEANRALLDAIAERKGVKLDIANSVWGGAGRVEIDADYLADAAKYFNAEGRVVDFNNPETLGVINGWVSGKTNGKIPNLLDRIPSDAVAYLVNAVYFKGSWKYEFEKKNTHEGVFTQDDGTKLMLPMMNMTYDLAYGRVDDVQFTRLAFKGDGSVGMYFALPAEGKLDEFVKTFDAALLAKWRQNMATTELVLQIPRFKLGYKAGLVEAMQRLGMQRPFGGLAEFPKFQSGMGNVLISRILHEAILEVNEEGAEAAAATAVEMQTESVREEPPKLIINRPFFVAIVDDATGAILFTGAIHKPEALTAK